MRAAAADYRMATSNQSPRRGIDRLTLFFALLASVSAAGLYAVEGGAELGSALLHAGQLMVSIAPIIVTALFIGGYIQALLPHDLVNRWLGQRSGVRGYVVAMGAGVLTPAGPFGAFPLILALRKGGAAFDVCTVYLTAWATLGIHRVVIWELPFLGADFVGLRVAASLVLPLTAGLLTRFIARGRL